MVIVIRGTGHNNSQHCWPNNVKSCCVRLHIQRLLKVWLVSNFAQQHATGCENGRNMQHPTMYTVFREFVIGSHSFKLLEIFAKISFSFFFLQILWVFLYICNRKLPNSTRPPYGVGEHNTKISFFSNLGFGPFGFNPRKFRQHLTN